MSQNHPDARRAAALRARLVAIAREAAYVGAPLPMRHELARLFGATPRQIRRHLEWLRDVGAITTQRRQGRVFVQEAQP